MSENMIPADVTLCTVTFGPPISFAGRGGTVSVKLSSTHTIIHAATGVQIRSGEDLLETAALGDNLVFQVPHVDQDGFVDSSGATVKNWAYTITGTVKFGALTIPVNRSFQVFEGQDVVDLDLVPSGPVTPGVTAPSASVMSVAGQTGVVSSGTLRSALGVDAVETTVNDLAAQKGAASGLAPLDAGSKLPEGNVPARLTAATLASTYARHGSQGRTDLGLGDAATRTVGAASGVAPLDAGSKLPEGNLPDRLSESALSASFDSVVNVLGFGADPLGVTDSGPAIRAALAALPASGGKVLIPSGTFKVVALQRTLDPLTGSSTEGDPIVINRSNVALVGAGKDATRLIFRGFGDVDPETTWQLVAGKVFRGSGISIEGGSTEGQRTTNVTVSGMTLDGGCDYTSDKVTYPADPASGDGWDPTHKGLRILNNRLYRDITFDDVRVIRFRGEGAHHAGQNERRNIIATRMEIADCIEGWCVEGTARFQGTISHCTTHGIEHWQQIDDCTIDAVVSDVQQIGIYFKAEPLVTPPGKTVVAPTTRVLRCEKGILANGFSNLDIAPGVIVEDATSRGYDLQGVLTDISIDRPIVRNRTAATATGFLLSPGAGSSNVALVEPLVERSKAAADAGLALSEPYSLSNLTNVAGGLRVRGLRAIGTTFKFTDQAEVSNKLIDASGSWVQVAKLRVAKDGLYRVEAYLRVVTAATTVALQCDFTDAGGAKGQRMMSMEVTPRLINDVSLPVGSFFVQPMTIQATGDSETKYVVVSVRAGTANQVFASASIREV